MSIENQSEIPSLKNTFKNASDIDLQNKEVAVLMGQSDETENNVLPGGIISKYGRVEAKETQSKKKKRNQAFMSWLLRQSIKKALTELQTIIDFHLEQIRLFVEQIKQANEELEVLDNEFAELEKELKNFQENGAFDLDEKGNLKNKSAEKVISDWEYLTGQKIDLNAKNSYGDVLYILMDIEKHKLKLEKDIQDNQQQYEYHEFKLKEAQKLKADLQSNDPERCRLALLQVEQTSITSINNDFDNSTQTKGNNIIKANKSVSGNSSHDDFMSAFPKLNEEFSGASTGELKKTAPDSNKIQLVKNNIKGLKLDN
ncbi:MAG: hypothetical protein P1U70_06995 [Saprospiraceae bacterium]|jgi:hypothetical protein|nr:hypothetical protein [Saprospiraceae bacterium]